MAIVARIARFVRTVGFGTFSIGLHLMFVVVCVLFATPASDSLAAQGELYEIDMPPALGQPHGRDEGKDLGSHVPKPPKMPEPEPFEAPPPPPAPPPDTEAIPTSIPDPDAAPPPEQDAGAESFSDADIDAALANAEGGQGDDNYDPTTPVGSENVLPGFGSPDGVPGGQGTAPKKISPQYLAILSSWARARFPTHGHGLGPPPPGKRTCAHVSIQISPDRTVTGTAMSSSGQEQWDAKVRQSLPAFQGAVVPADPDGGPPPPSIALNVCWD